MYGDNIWLLSPLEFMKIRFFFFPIEYVRFIFYNCTVFYTCISPWWHGIHCFSWLSDEQVFEISHVNLQHTESEEKWTVTIHRFPKECLNCSRHHPWEIWTAFLRFIIIIIFLTRNRYCQTRCFRHNFD